MLRRLLLPAAGAGIRMAAAVVAVLAVNQFTIPALLQVKDGLSERVPHNKGPAPPP